MSKEKLNRLFLALLYGSSFVLFLFGSINSNDAGNLTLLWICSLGMMVCLINGLINVIKYIKLEFN